MTSLYPGMLFYSTGLNKKSTPVRPEATPSEIDRKLSRAPFNGRPWPKNSPVSAVYDVCNSSTRMIILNNKLSRRTKGSRLRGQSDYDGDILQPEPERHITETPHTNWHHHRQCSVSVSERFVPIFPPGVSPAPEWVNKTQRPPMKFDNGSGVNPNHHIQCQGHMDYDIIRWYDSHRRPRSRTSTKENRTLSPILNDPNLSRGERRYLSSIAKIYSVDAMRQQKQDQYSQLMWKEFKKGSYTERDVEKYNRYLNTPRKTQFGPCDPFRQKRSTSAPGNRNRSVDDGESRPNTTQTATRAYRDTRGTSAATSSDSRPRGKRGGGRVTVSEQGSRQRGGKSAGKRKQEDLNGKPARVESPLILKPKKSSVSSLSSLDDEDEKEKQEPRKDDKTEDEEKTQSVDEKVEDGKEVEDKEKEDDSTQRATAVTIVVDEDDRRVSDDDDERSKISARDTGRSDDQRGKALQYRPTYGERNGRDGRSTEEDSPQEENESGRETYQQTSQAYQQSTQPEQKVQQKETSKQDMNGSPKDSKVLNGHKNGDAVAREEKQKEEEEKEQADNLDENGPELVHHVHKEGKDRPFSRLGGREQFMVVKKETENSDDDYSDDEEESQRSKNKVDDATDPVRGDHSDQNQTQSADGRANEQEAASAAQVTRDDRASFQDGEGKDIVENLSLQKDDGGSDVSFRMVEESNVGSSEQGKSSTLEPPTPTEASSQEKPSEISTIEY